MSQNYKNLLEFAWEGPPLKRGGMFLGFGVDDQPSPSYDWGYNNNYVYVGSHELLHQSQLPSAKRSSQRQ